jgi:hypothetical protein
VLGMKPRALHMLSMRSTTELHSQSQGILFKWIPIAVDVALQIITS